MSYEDVTVAKVGDLADGEMKQVSANGAEILLACVGGNFHAVSAHCPHYGAPLVHGALSGTRVVCPWHHSCFDVTTGDLKEPPAFDALQRFDVKVEGDQVVVSVPTDAPDRRTPEMTKRDPKDEKLFAIVGGGAAGYMASQTLREEGFTGRLVMITREKRLPYDRPNLSKEYLQGNAEPEWMPLRGEDFYAEHDIEVIEDREVENVDASAKTVKFADGESMKCDAILVATGGKPRTLPFQTEGQENVFLLRSFDDCDAIIAAAEEGKRVVVIGASFIGMEAAMSLTMRGCKVTVVAPGEVPFQNILGTEIGKFFQELHEKNGVEFRMGGAVEGFTGTNKVTGVTLKGGDSLDADLVVVGVGVKPATDILKGVELNKDGGVIVDEHFRAADGVYAAGDIAYFPSAISGGRQRIEHWRTAMQQGRVAGRSMAGKSAAYRDVPFFWTRQFGVALLYVGHAEGWDEIVFDGEVSSRRFLAFYIKENQVTAVAGMHHDSQLAAIEELMRLDNMPAVAELKAGPIDWLKLLSPKVEGRLTHST